VEWRPNDSNNVQILNETIDLYRYFDATKQAEFWYKCVLQTIDYTIPEEVEYMEKYDHMKDFLDNVFEIRDKMVCIVIRFLEKGNGKLSVRAKNKEFEALSEEEIDQIESKYRELFMG